jgi:hypothetical protein
VGDGFEVRTSALRGYADGADARARTLADLTSRVVTAELHRSAFGWVPGIGGRVHEAYSELLRSALDGLRQATDLTAQAADAVRVTADSYDVVDAVNAANADAVGAALPGGGS